MSKVKPTETQIQVVMSDWLGNLRQKDEGNYTHKGHGGIRRSKSEAISTYLIGDTSHLTQMELIKKARMAAEQVINAVVNEPTTIQVGGEGSYNTQDDSGRHVINIATDYFDDNTLTNRQKVDIMIGLASHEAAHSIYTEDDILEHLVTTEPELVTLKKNIWNTLEDERIEFLLGDERPGLADSLGATKEHYFKRLLERIKTGGKMPTEPLPKLLGAMQQAVRYPSEMTREEVEDCFDELNAIRRVLTPYPLTQEGVWEATDRIMDIIKDIAKKEAEKKQKQQQSQQGESEDESEPSPSSGNGGPMPDAKDGKGNGQSKGATSKSKKGNSSNSGQLSGPSKKDIMDALKQMMSTEECKNVLEAIKQDEAKGSGKNESNCIANSMDPKQVMDFINQDDSELQGGTGAGGGGVKSFVFKPKGSEDQYIQSLRRVRAFIPAMAKALSCKSSESDYVLRGLPSGRLNTNKLVAFRTGNKNIFNKQGSITCSTASVVMLIDESGSMSGPKLRAARDAAILIQEAINRIRNVSFYCYGYTTELLHVYSENGKTSKWALGGTAAISGTPTGDAMAMAAERVRRFTKDPCLMLVLTDGLPDDRHKVEEQDKALRTKRFIPIGVGILSSAVENNFKEHVVLTDISSFAVDLGHLTRGKLDKMLVRTESE